MKSDKRVVYSINVADIQTVAQEELGRRLTDDELKRIEDNLGDYIQWHDAIASAILNHITIGEGI